MCKEFSILFENVVRSLNVKPNEYYLHETENFKWICWDAIKKFENHQIVQAIKQNISVNQNSYFSNINVCDNFKEIAALNKKKDGTFSNISKKHSKEMSDICTPTSDIIWNKEIITQKSFRNSIKLAEVTTVFKKEMLHC